MTPGRWLIVAAAAAALFGAPLRVSAAGNELSAPTVTPASGTTATAFVLSVDYDGRFPALSVEVAAAGVSVPMTLVSGSLLTGTWSVTTSLPAGTWTVMFTAASERGNSETLAGPTVVVTDPLATFVASPTAATTPIGAPESEPGSRRPTETSTRENGPAQSSAAHEQVPAATEPATEPVPEPSAGDATPVEPVVSGGTLNSDGGTADVAPGGAATTSGDAAVSGSPAAGAPIVTPASAGVAASVEREPPSDANQVEAEEAAETPIVVGVAGLLAVALIGTRLILLGRRRRIRDDALAATAVAADTSAALERRTLRRARLRLGEDPVILALGIPTERERGPEGRTMTIDRDDAAGRDSLS